MRKNHYEKGSIPPQGKKRVGGTMGRKARIVASLRKAKKMKGSHYSVPAQMA